MNLKPYFITGTGRCGTMLLSRLFSLGENSHCDHESHFRHQSLLHYYRGNGEMTSFREDIEHSLIPTLKEHGRNGKNYGVSSGHLYFAIPELVQRFGTSAKFILLIRKPEAFVQSALARGFFNPSHPHACMQLYPHPRDEIYPHWATTTPFERCLWYWELVNSFVLNEFQKLPDSQVHIVRIEDLNAEKAMDLCNFIGATDILEDRVKELLSYRINATPDAGDKIEVNPYSHQLSKIKSIPDLSCQHKLLHQYTASLFDEIYGEKKSNG
jgi:hypothetical protein